MSFPKSAGTLSPYIDPLYWLCTLGTPWHENVKILAQTCVKKYACLTYETVLFWKLRYIWMNEVIPWYYLHQYPDLMPWSLKNGHQRVKYKHLLFGNSCIYIFWQCLSESLIILWKVTLFCLLFETLVCKGYALNPYDLLYASEYPLNIPVSSVWLCRGSIISPEKNSLKTPQ